MAPPCAAQALQAGWAWLPFGLPLDSRKVKVNYFNLFNIYFHIISEGSKHHLGIYEISLRRDVASIFCIFKFLYSWKRQ